MAGSKRVHMVGIGGAGMSAIAKVLLSQGVSVSGSDIADSDVLEDLRASGARVAIGHRAKNVQGASEVVLSSAIRQDNVEVVEARRLGIPIRHRSEVLADLMNTKQGIAVAGAHGKTTVTSMIAWTLHELGIEPTFLIGGMLPGLGGAKYGSGPVLVAEADESDRSFLRYKPYIGVVTSIEADHLENYGDSFENLKAGYEQFIDHITPDGWAVLGTDDEIVRTLGEEAASRGRHIASYGFRAEARYRAVDIRTEAFKTHFRALRGGEIVGDFRLAVPGRHNVQNALACIAVCDLLQIELDRVPPVLERFGGARRRFEVVGQENGVLVVDDYAHHPTEIKTTLNACKTGWERRLVAVFQPHRYSRTKQLMHEFARSFDQADLVILTDVYAPPPEEPIPGVSGERLAELVKESMGDRVLYAPTLADVDAALRRVVRPGDIVLTMGAGDIWKAARRFAGVQRS